MLMDACLFTCNLLDDSGHRADYTVSYDNETPRIAVTSHFTIAMNRCEERFRIT